MRKCLILIFCLALLPLAYAECLVPSDRMEIKESAIICSGSYNLKEGIKIAADNAIVQCNNSILLGDGVGYGILLKERNNTALRGCSISNYEVGIYLDSSNYSLISDNYLSKNKFGVGLFNSFNNKMENNVLEENSRNEEVNFQSSLINEDEITLVEEKEEQLSPQKIMEEVIRVKKPFLDEKQILEEVNSIFGKYFNITQQNVDITRSFYYNESDNSTRIVLRIKPKKILSNVSIYERIPKCVTTYVNQLLFETGGYEVIVPDPLILWSFSTIEKEEEISYKVFKNIDKECKELLFTFGIATGFKDFERKKEPIANLNYILLFSITISFALIFYFIKLRRKH